MLKLLQFLYVVLVTVVPNTVVLIIVVLMTVELVITLSRLSVKDFTNRIRYNQQTYH